MIINGPKFNMLECIKNKKINALCGSPKMKALSFPMKIFRLHRAIIQIVF